MSLLTQRENGKWSFTFGGVILEESVILGVLAIRIQSDYRWIEHMFKASKDAVKGLVFVKLQKILRCRPYS